jgi:hypothetical protein
MRIEEIDPRKIVIDSFCPLEVVLRDAIREHGLKNLQQRISVRREYAVVMGGRIIRALSSLLEEDAFCYDAETGCIDKASRVYQTVPVEIMG